MKIEMIGYARTPVGRKGKHTFCLEDGTLYKDGIDISTKGNIRLYKYIKSLHLFENKLCYEIKDVDYLSGSREEFLNQCIFSGHYIGFKLPPKTDEEIVDILFRKVDPTGKEYLFCSPDRMKLVYIYKNDVGSYSVGREVLRIAGDEDQNCFGYGWWEPNWQEDRSSYYETAILALNDIEEEIEGYYEITPPPQT